ncbi:Slm3 [Kluyveromyces lactis]|nr:Slm3 [Kluyveromyces lactis]
MSKITARFLELCKQRRLSGYHDQSMPSKFDNIVVGMSGGVDSSVCAALFAAYPNVHGVYMQNWGKDQSLTRPEEDACYEKEWKDAEKVAKHLNMPVEFVNFEKDYWLNVFAPMLEQYSMGYTPNPDIGCNQFVKFGKLMDHLDVKFGKNNYWLVMGHYARVLRRDSNPESSEPHLMRGLYQQKDQSYYLSQVSVPSLNQMILPIGHLTKPEVRELAKEVDLHTATKPDSQGICFVNNSQHGKFKNFLQEYLPSEPGNIITIDELTGNKTVWGKHPGIWSYTIGQKIGISLPQGDPRYQGAWYVSEKNKHTREIVIVRGKDNNNLFKDVVTVKHFKILSKNPLSKEELNEAINKETLHMQFRSLQAPVKVTSVEWINSNEFSLKLERKERAMAPGQYCCLYVNERVIGSGIIDCAR